MDTQSQPSEITPEQAGERVADAIEVLANLLADAHSQGGDAAVAETYEQIGDLILETLNSILENRQQTEH